MKIEPWAAWAAEGPKTLKIEPWVASAAEGPKTLKIESWAADSAPQRPIRRDLAVWPFGGRFGRSAADLKPIRPIQRQIGCLNQPSSKEVGGYIGRLTTYLFRGRFFYGLEVSRAQGYKGCKG